MKVIEYDNKRFINALKFFKDFEYYEQDLLQAIVLLYFSFILHVKTHPSKQPEQENGIFRDLIKTQSANS